MAFLPLSPLFFARLLPPRPDQGGCGLRIFYHKFLWDKTMTVVGARLYAATDALGH